ncbi:MAG: methionine biosynthesis protein MetW [Proteobacteria bacterium]|nr:methionine biosynthesis protein MetW [Pseudomonadota bacterium]MBU1138734.1 methionine biosynthesis protein MetW [Pseudomonadota bacterium]MBU1232190.1 methionine biosynthesis protein MetW [Pseudomonadota bacterium]MBU1417123.1 methionine biosynthesis protein MetW [Pseudomonadota bacterium]MBU1453819.1 methionine biosynthesis protein MetW [Pseudomonadota bacterium]
MRFDLQIIASWIEPDSRVLDLGCGSGTLLSWLKNNKSIHGTGIEQDQDKAADCISRGLTVLQGDLSLEVQDYPDNSFDYVILSQTLQQVYEPANLLSMLARIGKRVIVSFPNFSHYKIRWQLLTRGQAPKNEQLPYSWYDTPNIRVITLEDFRRFARDVGYSIIKEAAINTHHHDKKGHIVHWLTNLRATYGIFLIEKRPSEKK